jgi:putative Ca2+/H+ antiporter (TMEM165/GDT1 family)
MSTFIFALIAVALASIGGRDQCLTAALAGKLGKHTGLLVASWAVAVLTAAVAGAIGAAVADVLAPQAKQMLAAIALAVAAVEMAWPRTSRTPSEPTRSLFAYAIVLAARQVSDGPRFLIFAIAAAGNSPALAAAGGAIGSAAAVGLGWGLADDLSRLPLKTLRLTIAGLLLLAGVVTALLARGLVG